MSNRAPELPLPSEVAEGDRERAASWTSDLQAREGLAFHEVMRRVIDRLDEALGHEPRVPAAQTVLVLDPDQGARYALMLELEALGCSVRGAEGWDTIPADVRPDLVITELDVPGVDDPVAALRSRYETPVIVLTADARGGRHAAARAAGAAVVEAKPASPREMLRSLLHAPVEESP